MGNIRLYQWVLVAFMLLGFSSSFAATRQMEYLDRGVVAVKVSNGVYLSWRLLASDAPNTEFKIYRSGTLIKTVAGNEGTNFVDVSGAASSKYAVSAVVNGSESAKSKEVDVWADQYKTLTLDRPKQLTMPDGSTCTYAPGDMSVGDLDGDGQYELIVKWDPSNAKDNSQSGYTGNVYIDGYKLDGTKLWRIDLGRNIRAGAHYTQFMVYDLNGDGFAEVAMKTSDGTVDGLGKVIGTASADYRTGTGTIMSGKEFLTVFDGRNGAAVTTIDYLPGRSVTTSWGDTYGNRSERMLAAIAYLDGVHPSLVMVRGYYTNSYLVAY
ncbi:MAG: dockerin, partial [Fibrobacter sp.]|nr:dockerin [Fibrobacter sp.]